MIKLLANTLYSIRPSACLGASLFAVASYQTISNYHLSAIIFISVFFGSASCFLINDITDRHKDMANKKHRPIAIGTLPVGIAKLIAISFSLLYVALSAYLGTDQLLISIVTMLIFIAYPFINHRYGFLANTIVAICTVLCLLYGGLLGSYGPILYFLIAAVFFVIIPREIMLDVLDVDGDRRYGKNSLPVKFTERSVKKVIVFGYLLGSVPLVICVMLPVPLPISVLLLTAVLALWIPLILKWKDEVHVWALYNIRASHVFFAILVITLFVR